MVEEFRLIMELLLLLLAANGAPVVAARLLKWIANWPLDFGCYAGDGQRLLGASKTWRGVIAAVAATAVVAYFLGYPIMHGAIFGLFAMLGDTLSSFIKRRMGLSASAKAVGLDQIPEAVVPVWLMHEQFDVTWSLGLATVIAFLLSGIVLSKLLYQLHIRSQPH